MNNLLEYFNLNSYEELLDYIKNNADDPKVKELKEIRDFVEIKDKE
ncbi:hypothetical protein ACQRBF_00015 [Peptoniphilaceae bacterium SGI.131]